VTPLNQNVENTNQEHKRRFSNPSKPYKTRHPHYSLLVKSLFGGRLLLSPMAPPPWDTNIFNPLYMTGIQGYPHAMPNKFDKRLPKFSSNNVTSTEKLVDAFYTCFQNHPLKIDDEDMLMKLYVASLVEDVRRWYNNLPDKSIKSWEAFHSVSTL
jgi:hypothetical protein